MHKLNYLLILANVIGFLAMGYDKLKAKAGGQRIPELYLFIFALSGGATGVYAGMQVFRHKTKHNSFKLGIPLIVVLNMLIIYLVK